MALGFKQLSTENWTQPDETNRAFGRISPVAGPVRMREQDWAREFLAVELSAEVPEQIDDLFSIARGAMLYGWFFYPLFRLGEEQLYRVLEAAAKHRYRGAGGAEDEPSFHEAVAYLLERDLIAPSEAERWTAARRLRNIASHPEQAAVVPPGMALRMLRAAQRDIDSLFTSP